MLIIITTFKLLLHFIYIIWTVNIFNIYIYTVTVTIYKNKIFSSIFENHFALSTQLKVKKVSFYVQKNMSLT